jgi:hypothetical protein
MGPNIEWKMKEDDGSKVNNRTRRRRRRGRRQRGREHF